MRVLMMAVALPHLISAAALSNTSSSAAGSVSNATTAASTPAKPKAADTKASKKSGAKVGAVSDKDLGVLKTLDANYQAKSATMKVEKVAKIPLLDQERKSKGSLFISNGRLRMELEGTEKSLLVVNKKTLWAVTYPPAEFKDAAVSVIKSSTASKKGRSQSVVTLLSQGGFLKFFTPTAAVKDAGGDLTFFLTPKQEQTDFKRAQIKVSADGSKLQSLAYWDDRDNETRLDFSDVKFESKLEDKLFNYDPPANADVMNL